VPTSNENVGLLGRAGLGLGQSGRVINLVGYVAFHAPIGHPRNRHSSQESNLILGSAVRLDVSRLRGSIIYTRAIRPSHSEQVIV
jgi:hypothetical protein